MSQVRIKEFFCQPKIFGGKCDSYNKCSCTVESDNTDQVFILLVGAANIGTFTYVPVLSHQSQLESLAVCAEDRVALLQLAALCWEVYFKL